MRHNIFTVSLICVLLLAGCKEKPNPLRDAIVDKVRETNSDVEFFSVSKLETVSEVTLNDELARRQGIFQSKVKAYDRKAREFKKKRMQVNAAKMSDKSKDASDVVSRFTEYKENHSHQLDSVLYRIMKFDGFGYTTDRTKVEVKDYYVTVGNDGKVITILPPDGNPVRGMGIMIPEYLTEIIHSASEEVVEAE